MVMQGKVLNVLAVVFLAACNGRTGNAGPAGDPTVLSGDASAQDAAAPDGTDSVMSSARRVPGGFILRTDGALANGGSGSNFQSELCHACSAGPCQPQRSACSNDPVCKSAGSVAEECIVSAQTTHSDVHVCLVALAAADATAAAIASCLESHCATVCL